LNAREEKDVCKCGKSFGDFGNLRKSQRNKVSRLEEKGGGEAGQGKKKLVVRRSVWNGISEKGDDSFNSPSRSRKGRCR